MLAYAQVPRGETGESMSSMLDSAGDVFGFVAIMGLIAIHQAFKESTSAGIKMSSIVLGIVALCIWLPMIGRPIVGLIMLMFIWTAIRR